ncbi:ATPase inhibitor subunit zeta [Antarcticirhabdus aurantiaca]|uniref:ATPase inhibitor subunit zeta n=1 Tax=Antarcticirhabdus aurantiaca TaxID=2606717 RepID=A0ACD4NRI0_9HYPH|nr:ATPase inhibitor subunit zeta [Antarcticirhabdus aurantiaca]WAJ29255.1 ATPase inhibitor subunit zeta [Jeongeuplla avenae]
MAAVTRNEIAEKSFVIREERSFHSRARADRDAGLWMAGRMGLDAAAAEDFAAAAVEVGVRVPGGRGGFDHLAAYLGQAGINIEELRTRYALVMASAELSDAALAHADSVEARKNPA